MSGVDNQYRKAEDVWRVRCISKHLQDARSSCGYWQDLGHLSMDWEIVAETDEPSAPPRFLSQLSGKERSDLEAVGQTVEGINPLYSHYFQVVSAFLFGPPGSVAVLHPMIIRVTIATCTATLDIDIFISTWIAAFDVKLQHFPPPRWRHLPAPVTYLTPSFTMIPSHSFQKGKHSKLSPSQRSVT